MYKNGKLQIGKLNKYQAKKKNSIKTMMLFIFLVLLFIFYIFSAYDEANKININNEVISKEKELNLLKLNQSLHERLNNLDIPILSYVVFDRNQDKIIFEKNKDKMIVPASITKLFTIKYGLDKLNINNNLSKEEIENLLEKRVYINEDFKKMLASDASIAHIEEGEHSLLDLIYAMLLPSGNDATYAFSDYIYSITKKNNTNSEDIKERMKNFVEDMNTYFNSKGYNIDIVDPAGYSSKKSMTSKDILMISNEIMKISKIREIVSTQRKQITNSTGETLDLKNTNLLLDRHSKYYTRSVSGIKTGTFDYSNLVIALNFKEMEYIIVLIGAKDKIKLYNQALNLINVIQDTINRIY